MTVVDVDVRIAEMYTVVGDLGKQIEELAEAMMLLMGRAGRAMKSSTHPPVNVMLYGLSGTGKSFHAPSRWTLIPSILPARH